MNGVAICRWDAALMAQMSADDAMQSFGKATAGI